MSNRKFRPGAKQRPDKQGQMPQSEAEMREMVEKLNSLVGDTLVKAGIQAEAALAQVFEADTEEGLSDDFVRRMLKDCLNAAWQTVRLSSAVLGTIDIATLRRIVAGEFKLPEMMRRSFKAAGVDPTLYEGNEPEPKAEGKPQKRPRGTKHPVVVMMQNGLQAVRLINRITRATNPEVYNLRPKAA